MTKQITQEAGETIGLIPASDSCPHYLFKLDKIVKSGCKLCKADFREEIEGIYESQKVKNIGAIHQKIVTEKHFEITYPSVRNHLLYHYQIVRRNEDLEEYAHDLQTWVEKGRNKNHAIRSRIAILEREMVTIAEKGEGLDLVERRRNAEIIKKLAETIMSLEEKLEEAHEKMKPVTVIFKQLQIIIDDELGQSQNMTVRKVLSNVCERLKDSVGEMLLEE